MNIMILDSLSLEIILSLALAGIGVSSGLVGTYVKFLKKLDSLEEKTSTNSDKIISTPDNAEVLERLTRMERESIIFHTQVRTKLEIK